MRYFTATEFVKLSREEANIPITPALAEKIYGHIDELNPVRISLGKAIIVTSAYRPVWWEKTRGRSGDSEHTFKGEGAVDLTSFDLKGLLLLLKETEYTRIALYPESNFIHCDYKFPERGQRYFVGPAWDQLTHPELMDLL